MRLSHEFHEADPGPLDQVFDFISRGGKYMSRNTTSWELGKLVECLRNVGSVFISQFNYFFIRRWTPGRGNCDQGLSQILRQY